MELQMSWQDPLRVAFVCIARGPRLAARGLLRIYRYSFSALAGFHCRHLPTCSSYADEAIGRFGLCGGWMTLARLCRCHPFGTCGLDFVPRRCRAIRGGTCHGAASAGAEPIRACS
jgi:putative membrane protein insertion efficiency factor